MKRTLLTTFVLGLVVAAGSASAQDRNDVDKRVVIHRGNETVRRTVDERPNGAVERRTVTERPNGNEMRRDVIQRPNGNQVIRRAIRAPRRFRAPRRWVAPRGFAYRRFRLGERVPTVFLNPLYFLMDFAAYGLEPAPPGYVWIQEGSDAVLVNRFTGEVAQVEYDVFY